MQLQGRANPRVTLTVLGITIATVLSTTHNQRLTITSYHYHLLIPIIMDYNVSLKSKSPLSYAYAALVRVPR